MMSSTAQAYMNRDRYDDVKNQEKILLMTVIE